MGLRITLPFPFGVTGFFGIFAHSKNNAAGLLLRFNNLSFAEINNHGHLDRLAGGTDKTERFTMVKR